MRDPWFLVMIPFLSVIGGSGIALHSGSLLSIEPTLSAYINEIAFPTILVATVLTSLFVWMQVMPER